MSPKPAPRPPSSLQQPDALPRYDITKSYVWNYQHAPDPPQLEIPPVPGRWSFCGRPVDSPLGIPAGPLLNGRWILYYAALGFDTLTYKTVRSVERACYAMPNLQPVRCDQLRGGEPSVLASPELTDSWAVSFGMPSQSPDVWRRDIHWTRDRLPPGKLLSVSVVGTIQDGWTIEDLANDYAQCARWAVESGADVIETNFSCPNVSTCDGQLFQNPQQAGLVAARVRDAIGNVPYVAKIGHLATEEAAAELLDAVGPLVDALAMTNSIATTVLSPDGHAMFNGQRRGICGNATREASIQQTEMLARLVRQRGASIHLIGVGGVSRYAHVRQYLDAGAEAVQLATAAMLDPAVALKIRREWRESARQ